jgi:hypothetical protein
VVINTRLTVLIVIIFNIKGYIGTFLVVRIIVAEIMDLDLCPIHQEEQQFAFPLRKMQKTRLPIDNHPLF